MDNEYIKGPSIERCIDRVIEESDELMQYQNYFAELHGEGVEKFQDNPQLTLEYMDNLERLSMGLTSSIKNGLERAKKELFMPGEPLRGDDEWRVK